MVQRVNVTLDNVSPLINYSPPEAWREGTTNDSWWQWYDHGGTFTLTTAFGASASLNFNGTSVWIYGARRDNHAPFNSTIDGRNYFDDGYSSVNLFRTVLFPATQLDGGTLHTVSIMDSVVDVNRPYLDIDSVTYEVEIPDGYEQITQQDTADAFKFSPLAAWGTNPESLSSYSNNTGHVTSASDAYVVYTFEGNGAHALRKDPFSDNQTGSHVEIYGAVGPNNGAYTVQVDNSNPVVLNGTKNALHTQTLLYQCGNLVPGTHTVNISNTPFAGQTFSVDYAVIYSSSSTGSGGDDSGSSLDGGSVGGIVVGACASLLLILFCVFLWRRRRRPITIENPLATADQGTGLITFHTPTLPAAVEQYQPLSVSSNTALLQPPSASTPSPSHSNSSASNSGSRSRLVLDDPNPSSSGVLGPAQESAPASENTRPHQAPGYVTRPLPQQEQSSSRLRSNALALPPLPEGDLRNIRMQVEGRSQDFGPITFVPDPEHDGNLLPPDYYQATQPFPDQRR